MSRPLLISDCDDVILHMLGPFRDWLDEAHGIDFRLRDQNYDQAMRRRHDGSQPTREEMWALLSAFFDTEMHRQAPTPGARDALASLSGSADIVILTNLEHHRQQDRVDQLAAHGIHHRVMCNQGGKGTPVSALIEEFAPSVAVFVDDLAVHHESVATRAPGVWRLHMHMEPDFAPHIPHATHAHARIDDWAAAEAWIRDRFAAGEKPDPMVNGAITA